MSNLFSHITADLVKAERERTGLGMMECKRELQRAAILSHLDASPDVDLRAVLRWLVERTR